MTLRTNWSIGWGCLLALVHCGLPLGGQVACAESAALLATGSKVARDEATRAIPYRSLDLHEQQLVHEIVSNASLYRRMPTRVIDCDPEVFNFLGQHPQVVTEIWKLMGVCQIDLTRTGPSTFRATDSAGTTGTIRILSAQYGEGGRSTVLAYADGTYHGAPFARPVTARSILLLRSGTTIETNGRPFVTARLDSFMVVDRMGAELIAKTVQPLLAKTADHNFVETMKFVSTFSHTAERNPAGMQRLADQLAALDDATRAGMARTCQATAARYQRLSALERDPHVRTVSRMDVAIED